MNILERLEEASREYAKRNILDMDSDFKMAFLSNIIFGIETDNDSWSIIFGREILEVMNIIHKRENFEYIKNDEKYKQFLLVVNVLDRYGWIEQGSSIRGSWFNSYGEYNTAMGEIYDIPNISYEELNQFINFFNN